MWIYLIPVNPWVFEHTGVTTLAPPSWGAPEYTAMSTWEKKTVDGFRGRKDGHSRRRDEGCLHPRVCSSARGKSPLVLFSHPLGITGKWLLLFAFPPVISAGEKSLIFLSEKTTFFSVGHRPCLLAWTASELDCGGLVMNLMPCPISSLAVAVFSSF